MGVGEWAGTRFGATNYTVDETGVVLVPVGRQDRRGTMSVDGAPAGTTVHFRADDKLRVKWGATPPDCIVVEGPIRELVLEGESPLSRLEIGPGQERLEVRATEKVRLDSVSSKAANVFLADVNKVSSLLVSGGRIEAHGSVDELVLAREVSIGRAFTARHAIALGNVTLRLERDGLVIDDLVQDNKPTVLQIVGGQCTIKRFLVRTPLDLDGTTIDHLEAWRSVDPSAPVVIQGHGTLTIDRLLERPHFAPSVGKSLRIQVGLSGRVLEASGRCVIAASPGAICTGFARSGRPLSLQRIETAEGAELENVDIYSLDDAQVLAKAARLSPWIPRGLRARWEASRMEMGVNAIHQSQMQQGQPKGWGNPEALVRQRRAQFWSHLVLVLQATHASGRLQSEARLEARRRRRLSEGWGRERLLLTTYALVGYGERIGLPLLWLVVLALFAGPWFISSGNVTFASYFNGSFDLQGFVSALLAPLSFFRAVDPQATTPEGLGSLIVHALTRVLGTVLLFFSVVAARRTAKAE